MKILQSPMKGLIIKKYPAGGMTQIFGINGRFYKVHGMKGHNGLDFYMPPGTPILAAHDGYVYDVKHNPNGYGKYVRLRSNKASKYFMTVYGHMNSISVEKGQEMKVGDKLGIIGNTGFVISTDAASIKTVQYWGNAPANKGLHLHFGVRFYDNGVLNYNNGFFGYEDPLKYLVNNNEIMWKTIKEKNGNRVYAEDDQGNLYWITSTRMYEAGVGQIFEKFVEGDVIPEKVIGTFNKEY
ncbi:M23 family metallopeptidase [Candidatus Parcubacteria bacterium]|nr:M23 family metallopeptidase [Candidatus Parcubacteria bacterium]